MLENDGKMSEMSEMKIWADLTWTQPKSPLSCLAQKKEEKEKTNIINRNFAQPHVHSTWSQFPPPLNLLSFSLSSFWPPSPRKPTQNPDASHHLLHLHLISSFSLFDLHLSLSLRRITNHATSIRISRSKRECTTRAASSPLYTTSSNQRFGDRRGLGYKMKAATPLKAWIR